MKSNTLILLYPIAHGGIQTVEVERIQTGHVEAGQPTTFTMETWADALDRLAQEAQSAMDDVEPEDAE